MVNMLHGSWLMTASVEGQAKRARVVGEGAWSEKGLRGSKPNQSISSSSQTSSKKRAAWSLLLQHYGIVVKMAEQDSIKFYICSNFVLQIKKETANGNIKLTIVPILLILCKCENLNGDFCWCDWTLKDLFAPDDNYICFSVVMFVTISVSNDNYSPE